MTILCITTTGIPGIRPCTHRNQHRVTCADHDGWKAELRPGKCTGCLPRKADRGFLCHHCYDHVEQAYADWPRFVKLAEATDGRAVAPDSDGIRGSASDGYSNLPLTVLAIDECTRLLASFAGDSLDMWVSNENGARDAVQFAKAALTAYRTVEVEEQRRPIPAVRCNHCGYRALMWQPTPFIGGHVEVECQNCGHVIDQDRLERFEGQRTFQRRSEACADGDHDSCSRMACGCGCHERSSSLYTVTTPAHLLRDRGAA